MGNDESPFARACERCGNGALSPIARRVSKLPEPGHIDIFRCDICGHVSQHDTPHAPPKE